VTAEFVGIKYTAPVTAKLSFKIAVSLEYEIRSYSKQSWYIPFSQKKTISCYEKCENQKLNFAITKGLRKFHIDACLRLQRSFLFRVYDKHWLMQINQLSGISACGCRYRRTQLKSEDERRV